MTKDVILTVGRRKRAIAKALVRPGKGVVRVNAQPISSIKPEMRRLMIEEPLVLVGDAYKRFNIDVNVRGGGIVGQAEAARQAIALGLVGALGKKYEKLFAEYDRSLVVPDPRRTEPHKPSRSSAGPRRHKQRSKR